MTEYIQFTTCKNVLYYEVSVEFNKLSFVGHARIATTQWVGTTPKILN